jgi:phosphatidate cytidylyltransferase
LLIRRVITGAVLGAVVAVTLLFLPTAAVAAVLGVLWIVGAWEWAGLARAGRAGRAAYALALGVLMAGALWWLLGAARVEAGTWAVSWVAAAAWLVALYGIMSFPRPLAPALVLAFGVVALTPAWLLLLAVHGSGTLGPALALVGFALVWSADVGAFFVGRSVGRVKLAPRVSPGKTWEGVAGGVASAMAAGWLASVALGLPAAQLVPAAAAVAGVSVIGDLTVSMLKRNVGLKDSGRILPGHGGVMDRIDGLVAAVPIYTIGLQFAGLLPTA